METGRKEGSERKNNEESECEREEEINLEG